MLLSLSTFPLLGLLASAFETAHFGFEWQERISSLGLGENNVTDTGCALACEWLSTLIPTAEVLPSSIHAWKEKSFYWSLQQKDVVPHCYVQPTSAEDVAAIVVLAKRAECPFAVKSGGHGAFAGASNIPSGITIDLQLLNAITLSSDKTTTRIGPGNRWTDVYNALTPQGVSVVGGRVAEIGVGGLLLGGGISFFSGRRGWAMDSVRRYEVVTASGEVLDVDFASHPELYWALRGGGNNFGIVTAFELETFPQGEMWGGMVTSTIEHNVTLLDAMADYAHNSPQDPDAQAYVAFVWNQENGIYLSASELVYARPVENPALLENFTKVPNVHSTLKVTNMADLAMEMQQNCWNGFRESYWTATFKATREIEQIIFDIFIEEVEPIKHLDGILPAMIFQAMTTDMTAHFSKNGGNCFGIADTEGPFFVINFAVWWNSAADDEVILAAAERIIDRSTEKAKEIGAFHRYLYQNYADISQDVFAGYGEENLKRLREVSRRYDPEQVFQRLQPGYFKL